MMKYRHNISESQIKRIRQVEYFKQGMYADLDIAGTLDFFYKRYVRQISDFTSLDHNTTVSDIGAGFGWLSITFALNTDVNIIAIEPNVKRLNAGKEIADILGVGHRISWKVGTLGDLPLKDRESDISYCIEVIEHVKKDTSTIHDLCRITNGYIVLTTPNLWFPIIAHDTQLPFCHWLPFPVRQFYAKIFNRSHKENDNLFWSPWTLDKNMKGFKRISIWLHYSNYHQYLSTFPYYLPYGKGKMVSNPGSLLKLYYGLISKTGKISYVFTPNLAGVFKRKH